MKTKLGGRAIRGLIITLAAMFSSMACQTVKPYQKTYLNDSSMRMGFGKNAGFEHYSHMIREGASGAGGKNSGGCGCN